MSDDSSDIAGRQSMLLDQVFQHVESCHVIRQLFERIGFIGERQVAKHDQIVRLSIGHPLLTDHRQLVDDLMRLSEVPIILNWH